MFQPDWLILGILHQSFEIERPKGHWSEVVVHLYVVQLNIVLFFVVFKKLFVDHVDIFVCFYFTFSSLSHINS